MIDQDIPRFKERLLSELSDVVEARRLIAAPAPAPSRPRRPGWRRVPALTGIAALAVALAVLPVVTSPRESGSQAFAVIVGADGVIEVNWSAGDFDDGPALQRRLREAGVDVRVDTVPASPSAVGKAPSFSTGSGLPPPGIAYPDDGANRLTIDPAVFTGTVTLTIGVEADGQDYAFMEEVFEPGEPFGGLHCRLGEPVTAADLAPYADRAGVRIAWSVITSLADDVNGGWSMTSEQVDAAPDGQVVWGYARNADVVDIEVLPEGQSVPEGWETRLSDLACTPEQAARWQD